MNYGQYSAAQESKALTQIRTLSLTDVLREPLNVTVGSVSVLLDASVTAGVIQHGENGDFEINDYDFDEIYMSIPGLNQELVKLDATDFRINQKALYNAFCEAIEGQIINRAMAAADSDWSYETA